MRAKLLVAALAALLVGTQAGALSIPLTAKIEAGQVVPPTASVGFGTGTFVYDDISHILTWAIVITDALFGSPEVGSAIHGPAAVGFTAPALTALGVGSLKLGSIDLDDLCGDPAGCEDDLLGSLWYVEVATDSGPEIRGQIIPVLPVPEAAAWLLMATGLAGLTLVGRRS